MNQESEKLLAGLNDAQRAAATTFEGPVLVLAGAGTGKTRVVTVRIACMISEGIPPEHILGMTFTNKAAAEMRERLGAMIGSGAAGKVTLGTFHSFCMKILRKEISVLGYMPGFSIADEADSQGIIKQAIGIAGGGFEELDVATAASFISRWKNERLFPEDALEISAGTARYRLAEIYNEYQRLLKLQNLVDFDDLLLLVWKIFKDHPGILKNYQEQYPYLLVDEYQDTNAVQFELVASLAAPHNNLCVVGDDDQSIYGWRGADVGNILEFPDRFRNAKCIKLEQNYRSTNSILKAANAVISTKKQQDFGKRLWSQLGDGEPIRIAVLDDGEAEAQFIADSIQEMKYDDPALRWSDFALLYRSNHLSRVFETCFRRCSIPVRIVGGQEFFKRREIKDAIAYLTMCVNPGNDQALLRLLTSPPRGLGDKAVEALKSLRAGLHKPMSMLLGDEEFLHRMTPQARKSASALAETFAKWRQEFSSPGDLAPRIELFLRETGYIDGLQKIYKDAGDVVKRRDNIDEFISAAAEFQSRQVDKPAKLEDFLASFALLEDNTSDEDKADNDAVILSTVHASKGLEFPNVFLIGMENGCFPHERSKVEGTVDEELRLFYVAITRARKRLTISRSRSRMNRGRREVRRQSDFLRLLPPDLVQEGGADDFIRPPSQEELLKQLAGIMDMLK